MDDLLRLAVGRAGRELGVEEHPIERRFLRVRAALEGRLGSDLPLHIARVVVAGLGPEQLERIVSVAARLMRANVGEPPGSTVRPGMRRTTGRLEPAARFWVYGRGGKPCRRCGETIRRAMQGVYARSTYWCPRCQEAAGA